MAMTTSSSIKVNPRTGNSPRGSLRRLERTFFISSPGHFVSLGYRVNDLSRSARVRQQFGCLNTNQKKSDNSRLLRESSAFADHHKRNRLIRSTLLALRPRENCASHRTPREIEGPTARKKSGGGRES